MSSTQNNDTIAASVQQRASDAYSYASRSLDRVVPPSSRQRGYDAVLDLASTRPILFTLILIFTSLSFFPVLLFTTFTFSTLLFALSAALVFSLFWISVAVAVLLPTLLLAALVAVIAWIWVVGSFLVMRWVYRQVPLHMQGEGEMELDVSGRKVRVEGAKGENGIDGTVKRED